MFQSVRMQTHACSRNTLTRVLTLTDTVSLTPLCFIDTCVLGGQASFLGLAFGGVGVEGEEGALGFPISG